MLFLKLKNIFSFLLIVVVVYTFYKFNMSYYNLFDVAINLQFNNFFSISYKLWDFFFWFLVGYSFIYIIYQLFFVDIYSKPYLCLVGIFNSFGKLFGYNNSISYEEKQAMLNILLKSIFIPLMLSGLNSNMQSILHWLGYLIQAPYISFLHYYYTYVHWLLISMVFFLDILIFTVGYMVELKILKNSIKSVEPTFLGWFVALSCYPLYSYATSNLLSWYSSDLPDFTKYFSYSYFTVSLSAIFGIFFLIMMCIYLRASFSLGFKASNLTNRGVVSRGPYSFVRHPAYFSKNLARIVGAVPILIYSVDKGDPKAVCLILFSLIGWVFIYHLRAITEENHLSMDEDYIKYKDRVKYMYIPKFF